MIIKSITGNYREEHLFTLRQSLESYHFFHQQMRDYDEEIKQRLDQYEPKEDDRHDQLSSSMGPTQRKSGNAPPFDLQEHMYRIFGTALTRVDGISTVTAQILHG